MEKDNQIYQQYAYSYPHKLAYRELVKPLSLQEVWGHQNRDNLFAYLHIPYCEMRCGFCNLFTISNPKEGVNQYLAALKIEAQTYKYQFPDLQFEAYAIGGGTPTYLHADQLADMLETFRDVLGVNTNKQYGSIESSPKSISKEKIELIEEYGINRVSIGVQSWIEEETKHLGRPQQPQEAAKAVQSLVESKIPELNIDLIYGIKGQTEQSWLYSLLETIQYQPTEIYLYPLYTRPLTGLEKMNALQASKSVEMTSEIDNRLARYRFAREFLLSNDYEQVSMRCFRRLDAPIIESDYVSTRDGMIGIGAGARSYTNTFHYSSHYAVGRKATKSIIHGYSLKNDEDFNQVHYGIHLDKEEQVRRYFIKSLIDGGVLNMQKFNKQFGRSIFDYSIINDLFDKKWLKKDGEIVRLTVKGMELEDQIGPSLFSTTVNDLMSKFQLA